MRHRTSHTPVCTRLTINHLLKALCESLNLVLLALGEALALAAGCETRDVGVSSIHRSKGQRSSERCGCDNLADLNRCLLMCRARRYAGHLSGLASHWSSTQRLHGAFEGQLMLGSLRITHTLVSVGGFGSIDAGHVVSEV